MTIPEDNLDILLARHPALWRRLSGASLFMTGGTGWFGRRLLEALAHANRELGLGLSVTVLTRTPQHFATSAPHLARDPFLTLHPGDVRHFDFPAGEFTHLIHAAAPSARETFMGADPLDKFETLVSGTRRVLAFAAQTGIRHFLFLSSGVAYGNAPCHVTEDNLLAPSTVTPESALGEAKRAAEFLCAVTAAKRGWHSSMARCFAFVGPGMPFDLHYAIGGFIAQAMRGVPIILTSDGSPVRSWLYDADLVIWLLTLLLREGSPRLYNVGSDQAMTLVDAARIVRDLLNPGGEIQILAQTNASIGNPARNAYVPDISRAREELGLDVWTPFPEAVKRT
ncbi:MAG: NAD(P)-dependent oxidoreductase, partial [Zoogloeaceae bacterium]|nr:NAD(P)-dependent oxidoreductase [Zoogloeaceae bacterium]